jgi:cell wall-associated NlpC family hydrolase
MGADWRHLVMAGCLTLAGLTVGPQVTAQASTAPNYGGAALSWAEANATGDWYQYGATGPYTYDCSGLVSTAVKKATGIWIGRDTYEMLATMGEGHFERISLEDARRGDVLFFGSGHVTFDTRWYHIAFQAEEPGTRVGWYQWGWGWVPTMAFRIV